MVISERVGVGVISCVAHTDTYVSLIALIISNKQASLAFENNTNPAKAANRSHSGMHAILSVVAAYTMLRLASCLCVWHPFFNSCPDATL